MGLTIKTMDEMMRCPCGVITDQAIVWDYPVENLKYYQVMCRTCQRELLDILKDSIKNY